MTADTTNNFQNFVDVENPETAIGRSKSFQNESEGVTHGKKEIDEQGSEGVTLPIEQVDRTLDDDVKNDKNAIKT